MSKVKHMELHENYQTIWFDIKSWFTVSLNDTVHILLPRIDIDKDINKNLTKKE